MMKASGGDVADDFADDEENEGERIKRAGGYGERSIDKIEL